MTFKIMESGTLKDVAPNSDDDYDMTEPQTTVYVIEMTRDEDQETLTDKSKEDINGYFRFSPCGCSGDCCGHRHGGVTAIRPLYGNRHIVVVHSSRNY